MPSKVAELPLGCRHEILSLYRSKIAKKDFSDAFYICFVEYRYPRANLVLNLGKRFSIFALTRIVDIFCLLQKPFDALRPGIDAVDPGFSVQILCDQFGERCGQRH